jgi:hypothetical protein
MPMPMPSPTLPVTSNSRVGASGSWANGDVEDVAKETVVIASIYKFYWDFSGCRADDNYEGGYPGRLLPALRRSLFP